MSATIDSTGAIDILCDTAGLVPTKNARLTFRAWSDVTPPFKLRVQAPSGSIIIDRVIRDLPTGEPQAPEPVSFSVVRGEYKIEIAELRGSGRGAATLRIP